MDDLILKIAKKLKIFTLDDLIIMGDLDENLTIETMNKLVTENKIKLAGKFFEYAEVQQRKENYKIIDKNIEVKNSEITMIEAIKTFLVICKNKNLSDWTLKTYKTLFNSQIIPYFKKFKLKNITVEDVSKFKIYMQNNKTSERRIKNILALLNQLIKYFQNEDYIERTCVFEVKRLEKIPKREIQVLTKNQVEQLFSILEAEYKYLLPIIEKVMQEKLKLNDILTGDKLSRERQKRKTREDFAKIKQKLNLENFMFDDLRFSDLSQI